MNVETTVTELFNQFAKGLKEAKSLTKASVGELFKETIRPFVEEQQKKFEPVAKKSKPSKLKDDSDSDSNPKPQSKRLALSTWASIFPSKTCGLASYFKDFVAEKDLKEKKGSMLVHCLRREFEGTDQWEEYLSWVRKTNKNAPKEDPKPECSTWQTVLQSGPYGLPTYFEKEADEIRKGEAGVKHFKITKQLRDTYEFTKDGKTNTKEWLAYLKWVKAENKNCPEGEPSPRGEKTEQKEKKVVAKKTEKKEQPKESDEKGLGLEMDLEDM